MSLKDLMAHLENATGDWAKSRGLPAPEGPIFAPAPPHVRADFSESYPLKASKAAKKNPVDLARDLSSTLAGIDERFDSVEASAPGFVNFHLTAKFLLDNLREILARPETYGADPAAPKRSVLIEFVSANPTGPVHLASGRAATLGDSLAKILRRIGHKVETEYYVNNTGRQVKLLGQSAQARWLEQHGKTAEFPEEGYRGSYIQDVTATAGNQAAGWSAMQFGEFAMERLLAEQKCDMEAFGVHFDRWFLESELYKNNAVEKTLALLKERGMVQVIDGATWLILPGEMASKGLISQNVFGKIVNLDDKERVLVRSDGEPTYFLKDIAYHKNKYDRGWEELIDIWGADHHGYVPRMQTAVAALGKDPSSFHPIIHQMVHLYRGKEIVKMSKRAGELVTLRDLLAEVGPDACRFFFAMRGPNVHMNFDLELAKKQTQENPVYYVQYVHARICSVLREAAKAGISTDRFELPQVSDAALDEPEERALLVKLAWFPEMLDSCETVLSPHPLATYLMETAGLFHTFYEKHRVVDSSDRLRSQARLALCAGIRAVVQEGLGLLGVSAPEKM